MKTWIPLGGLLCAALLCGCQDNSHEISKLQADLAAERKRFDAASDTWASERDAMRADIAALKAQLGTLDTESAAPMAERIKELETRVDAGGKPDPELAARVEALGKKVENLKDEAVEAARMEAAKAASGEMDEEKIAALMAKKLAEEQAANAPTKNLQQALDRLDVSQAEKDQIRQSIIDAKQQILEALEVPTEDGRVLAEELIDTFIKIPERRRADDRRAQAVRRTGGKEGAGRHPGAYLSGRNQWREGPKQGRDRPHPQPRRPEKTECRP
ncbi:MAG: hypothetical protein M5U25_05275 [Planctomycetota bacterium]|nr:hypothetical protein [Planctomycetota bacterium]